MIGIVGSGHIIFLKYAAYYCLRGSGRDTTIETCRLLLDMGAHADWEDEIGKCVISSKYVPTEYKCRRFKLLIFKSSTPMNTMIRHGAPGVDMPDDCTSNIFIRDEDIGNGR